MKVTEIMTTDVRTCTPATNLAEAAELMLDGDCGALPVVDAGRLVGMVTDRDMFIALATRDQRASDLTVGRVAGPQVWTCGPDEDLQTALATMQRHRVRRLPVAGFGGMVLGIVSMNDILRAAGSEASVRDEDVVEALQSICAKHHPTVHVTAA